MRWKPFAAIAGVLVPLGILAWGALELRQTAPQRPAGGVPTTTVKRGEVVITVTARGELQGGHSEMLSAPMVGGAEMALTSLREPGELVQAGDVVAQFDTTDQEFKLREAEADLAEAEQQVLQAQADSQAKTEEAHDELLQAQADLRQAELEERRNPLLAAIVARQNTLAVEAARDHLRQVQHDLANRKANTEAGVAIQEAARNKAKVQAEIARRNIESMTLKAHSEGYVAVQPNMSGGMFFYGMTLPILQTGDTVRSGMAVAQIPDLKNWEISARIGELDRGHLAADQKATLTVVALAGRAFHGHVKQIGNTTGPPWDRRFDTRVAIDDPAPDLRPGMTANVVITTEVVPDALWVPSQALFESDGRTFVYLRGATGFVPFDVKLLRRSETQVVLGGLAPGQTVALANPAQQMQSGSASGGAMQAMPKK